MDEDLDYATVHKTREKGRVVNVEKRVVYGSEERIEKRLEETPSSTINTSFVERSNLNWRLWDAYLTRKSPTFARSKRWLAAKFSICVAVYNFVRPHETLSRLANRVFNPKTPAMAAELTDHPWTIYGVPETQVFVSNDMGTSPTSPKCSIQDLRNCSSSILLAMQTEGRRKKWGC